MTEQKSTHPNVPHPAAIVHNGVQYLSNAQGDLVALANIKAIHLLEDEMVRKIVAYGEDLSAELTRYSIHTDADIAAFDALSAQNYGVEPKETKGNRTFTTYDGLAKVQVAVSQRIKMGPALQDAKAVLDAMILERGEGVDPFLITLVHRAFKVDQEGQVDVRAILALRRLEVDDPRWPKFCAAIDDAIQPDGSKRYIRLYRRPNGQAAWKMIPLDLAAIEPTPAAFERRSLRRQVEELTAELSSIEFQLSRAEPTLQGLNPAEAVGALLDLCGTYYQQAQKDIATFGTLTERNDRLEMLLAWYVEDEDCANDGGEPYGTIPTEIGMAARAATADIRARAHSNQPAVPAAE